MNRNRSLIAGGLVTCGALMMTMSLLGQGPDTGDVRPTGRGNVIRGAEHGARNNAGPKGAGTNGISYHGGPVLHTSNLYYILYGNWSGGDPTGPAILEHWANVIAPSPYFNINSTYYDSTGSVPNAVRFVGTYTATRSLGTTLSDNGVAQLATDAINQGFGSGAPTPPGTVDPNGLYMVLTAPGVGESSGFLTQYCGWHWSGSFVNGAITPGTFTSGDPVALFGFIGNASGPKFANCAAQSTGPNGDAGADAMISILAHELSETVSDPQGNAWYDSNGEENGDKCAWTFGNYYTAPNGSAANVNIQGTNYLMQQIWVNANGGGCVLSYSSNPDFSVSVSGSQTVAQGGTSGNYTLTATPVNGFTGPVSWAITPPSGITASTPAAANTATFTLTAASNLAAGTYTIPITGTYGLLNHSTSATLVVSAPTYSLSITPTSQSVTRPTSGSTLVTYSVKVVPVGNFTNGVNLSVSGSTTGVSASFPSGTNPVTPGGTATLNVTVSSNARRTTLNLTVTGTSSGQSNKTARASLTVH